ncbi:helix-turn-helix domain-containing protein [Deinococcus marmoris]|uniref:helix-turn-helix domain-containing protein n=1 Tax=Deinococcus marmoris TaxID=249408 RepID=UPI0009DDEBA1|nr:winged helix-turn-helix domain-containing protein [Deinococcus marmoris]
MTAAEVLPCERKRYLALWHVAQGQTPAQIAALGLMSAKSVRIHIHLYRQGGLDALQERVHPGRTSVLTPTIMADLEVEIKTGRQVWNSRSLVAYVAERYGITVSRTAMRTQLHHTGLSWQRTRLVVAGQADPEMKVEFKTDLEAVKRGL